MANDHSSEFKTSVITTIDVAIREIRQITTDFVLTNDYSLEALAAYRDAIGDHIIDLVDTQVVMTKIISDISAPPLSGQTQ